jgi:outer membrane protein OmpA-like peptidoglycan-associated protein
MKNLRNIGVVSLVIGVLLLSFISISSCTTRKQKNEIADLTEKVEQIEKDMAVLKSALAQKEAENQQLKGEIDSLNTFIVKKEQEVRALIFKKDEEIRIAKSTSPSVAATGNKVNKLTVIGYFGFDKKDISPEFKAELKKVAEFSQKYKSILLIQGYADPQGDNNYNIMLSLQRAKNTRETILNFIGSGQIPCDIVTVGLGTPAKAPGTPNKDKRKVIVTVIEDCTGRK